MKKLFIIILLLVTANIQAQKKPQNENDTTETKIKPSLSLSLMATGLYAFLQRRNRIATTQKESSSTPSASKRRQCEEFLKKASLIIRNHGAKLVLTIAAAQGLGHGMGTLYSLPRKEELKELKRLEKNIISSQHAANTLPIKDLSQEGAHELSLLHTTDTLTNRTYQIICEQRDDVPLSLKKELHTLILKELQKKSPNSTILLRIRVLLIQKMPLSPRFDDDDPESTLKTIMEQVASFISVNNKQHENSKEKP